MEPAALDDRGGAGKRLPWAERREELLAAAERVIARDGLQASMKAIATEAGVSKPIVYRHFKDKNGFAYALGERYSGDLLAALKVALVTHADPRDRIAACLEVFLRQVDAAPATYRFLTRGSAEGTPAVGDALEVFMRRLGDELAAFMIADDPDKSPDRQRLLFTCGHGIVGLARSTADVWLDRRHATRAELVEQLTDFLWGGFAGLGYPRPDQA